MPVGGVKSSLERVNVLDERTESGRGFQTVGAAAQKQREPKIRLMRGTCKRLEEKDDYTFCQKNDIDVANYKFNVDKPMVIIFDR